MPAKQYLTLRDWYGADAIIHRATLNRSMGRHFLSPGEPYPAGTLVDVYLDDPERPGMADVQLPNGDLLRTMATDVTVISPEGENVDGFVWVTLANGNVGCNGCGSAENNPFHYCGVCRMHKRLDPEAIRHPVDGPHYRGIVPTTHRSIPCDDR